MATMMFTEAIPIYNWGSSDIGKFVFAHRENSKLNYKQNRSRPCNSYIYIYIYIYLVIFICGFVTYFKGKVLLIHK